MNMLTLSTTQIVEVLKSIKLPQKEIEIILKRLRFYNALNMGEGNSESIPIDSMNLSTAVKNILLRENIYTEQQLKLFVKTKGIKGLKNLRNMGDVKYGEMENVFPWLKNF